MDANVRRFIIEFNGTVDLEANHAMTPDRMFRGFVIARCNGRSHVYFVPSLAATPKEAEAEAAREALSLSFDRAEWLSHQPRSAE